MEPKRLYRLTDTKMIAGICSGLAAHFNLDPVIVRLVFVLALFVGIVPAVAVYLVLWVIVPEKPVDPTV